MKGLCVFLKRVAATVIATTSKEKLTSSSPDEIGTAVRNPDTGSKPVWTNSENVSEVYCKLERGDARAHDDHDEGARPKSSVFCKLFFFFATFPLSPFEATV